MELYLDPDLVKSEKQTGEERGGKYVARVRTGTEKDGSPKYRYFMSAEEYNAYLQKKKRKERTDDQQKKAKKLASKLKKERSEEKKDKDKKPVKDAHASHLLKATDLYLGDSK